MSGDIDSVVAMSQGLAYAWAWRDATGDHTVDPTSFAIAYHHARTRLGNAPSIQDAHKNFRETGAVGRPSGL